MQPIVITQASPRDPVKGVTAIIPNQQAGADPQALLPIPPAHEQKTRDEGCEAGAPIPPSPAMVLPSPNLTVARIDQPTIQTTHLTVQQQPVLMASPVGKDGPIIVNQAEPEAAGQAPTPDDVQHAAPTPAPNAANDKWPPPPPNVTNETGVPAQNVAPAANITSEAAPLLPPDQPSP